MTPPEAVAAREFQKFCHAKGLRVLPNGEYAVGNSTETARSLDPWNDRFMSVRHLLMAFHTLSSLADLVEEIQLTNQMNYTGIVVLRPDTAIIHDIDFPQNLPRFNEFPNSIYIPSYQGFRGHNDRVAYGPTKSMLSYMRRGNVFRDTQEYTNIGEIFLRRYLAERKIEVRDTTIRVVRIRAECYIDQLDTSPIAMVIPFEDPDFQRCLGIVNVPGLTPISWKKNRWKISNEC